MAKESYKIEVIETMFDERWDHATGTLTNPRVTNAEMKEAIARFNKAHATDHGGNPYNFFKDFVRVASRANANWPPSVFRRGYTAIQKTGNGDCFLFVPLKSGQTEAFIAIREETNTPCHNIESVSMPLASRELGRIDESWLLQVIVRLRLIETHLSLYSNLDVIQVDHLQMSVKRVQTEIDALYLVTEGKRTTMSGSAIVCLEAKGPSDDILESQVVAQAQAVLGGVGSSVTGVVAGKTKVIPMAAKTVGQSRILLVEFDPVIGGHTTLVTSLTIAKRVVYHLMPHVPGIGRS